MKSKIAVTGANGFVGQNLVPYLLGRGNEILIIQKEQLYAIDYHLFNECESVIHLAGKAHDLKKTSNPDEYYQVNFELTKKLYDVFLRSDAKRFIFLSSVKAAADTVEGVLDEDILPSPKTDYGKSKRLAEEYIQNQKLPIGKSFYILRPCMIHGPGNKGNLNLLFTLVNKGIPYPFSAFTNQRSFLFVENLCFIISKLLIKNIESGIYNVADDESISTNSVVRTLANSISVTPKLIPVNRHIIRVFARIGDLLRLPLNTDRLTKLTESYVVGNEKIKHKLGISLPYTVSEGLVITAKSFKHQIK